MCERKQFLRRGAAALGLLFIGLWCFSPDSGVIEVQAGGLSEPDKQLVGEYPVYLPIVSGNATSVQLGKLGVEINYGIDVKQDLQQSLEALKPDSIRFTENYGRDLFRLNGQQEAEINEENYLRLITQLKYLLGITPEVTLNLKGSAVWQAAKTCEVPDEEHWGEWENLLTRLVRDVPELYRFELWNEPDVNINNNPGQWDLFGCVGLEQAGKFGRFATEMSKKMREAREEMVSSGVENTRQLWIELGGLLADPNNPELQAFMLEVLRAVGAGGAQINAWPYHGYVYTGDVDPLRVMGRTKRELIEQILQQAYNQFHLINPVETYNNEQGAMCVGWKSGEDDCANNPNHETQ